MRMLVGKRNGLHTGQHRLDLIMSIVHATNDLLLCFDGLCGRELPRWKALRTLNDLKFSRGETGI
jgi:hypothetical protein